MAKGVKLRPLLAAPSDRCQCGQRSSVPHKCQYQQTTPSDGEGLTPIATTPATSSHEEVPEEPRAKKVKLTALPAPRRKSKGRLSPFVPSRQVNLRGMPADVFHPEPFNAYPIPTIGCVHRMVEHFLRVWAPQQGKPFAFEGHPNPYLSLLFPYALQQPVLFESMITMCRVSWLLENGMNTTDDRAFAYHHNSTRHGLQMRLGRPETASDDPTLLTVAALSTVDYSLGRHVTAEMYLKNMRHIVEQRGGLRTDSPWEIFVTSMVTAFEGLWTFVLSNQPQATSPQSPQSPNQSYLQNEIPVYVNHPFPPEFTLLLSKVSKNFSDLAVSGVLSIQVIRIISRIPQGTRIPDPYTTPSGPPELHHILTDLLRLITLSTTKMENVLCAGLIAYCLPLLYGLPLPSSVTTTLKTCIDCYMKRLPDADEMDKKCLMWTAVAISGAVDMSRDKASLYSGVLEQVINKNREMRKWKSLEIILKEFLWHEELAKQWQLLWQVTMSKRQTPPNSSRSSPTALSPPPDGSRRSSGSKSMSLDAILHKDDDA